MNRNVHRLETEFREPIPSGWAVASAVLVAVMLMAPAVFAQPGGPFDGYAIYGDGNNGYSQVPNAPALNPTSEITLEAWIYITTPAGCPTVVGKGFVTNYWLGVCTNALRSYVGGNSETTNSIDVPDNRWVHVAMTSDGTTRRHYIDGSLVSEWPESGTLTPNGDSVRMGQDTNWSVQFNGSIDEVRLWSVARTTEEIRRAMKLAIERDMPGLVAVWGFGPNDSLGTHDGVIVGDVAGLTNPLGQCSNSTSQACLQGQRFIVTTTWSTTFATSGDGVQVPPTSEDTALFWFFDPNNWELMVKVLDGCGINDRFWVFIAAGTDQGYEVTVKDSLTGDEKVFSKAPGPAATTVTDTAALDVCNPF